MGSGSNTAQRMNVSLQDASSSPPFARRVARRLRLAARTETGAQAVRQLSGVVALRSRDDPQAATIRVREDSVCVEHGLAGDAGVTFTVDPASFGIVEDGAAASDVAAALRDVLDPPGRSWQDAAEDFWQETSQRSGTPPCVRVVCTDDGAEVSLGHGEPHFELHGPARHLHAYFDGDVALLLALFAGLLRVRSSLAGVSVMQGNGLAVALGDDA